MGHTYQDFSFLKGQRPSCRRMFSFQKQNAVVSTSAGVSAPGYKCWLAADPKVSWEFWLQSLRETKGFPNYQNGVLPNPSVEIPS